MTTPAEILTNVDTFRTAMLTTLSPEGVLHARPMTVAGRDENILWFATHLDSTTVSEVRTFESANASFQSALLYLSISGRAEVVNDRAKIAELWNDTWTAWFPKGPNDPDLVLIRLDGSAAEIWDMRGAKGIQSALRALSSIVTRKLDQNLQVREAVSL